MVPGSIWNLPCRGKSKKKNFSPDLNIPTMKTKKKNIKNFLLSTIVLVLLVGCKNENQPKDNSGWFSDEVEYPAEPVAIGDYLEHPEGLLNQEEVHRFYSKRDNEPVWNNIEIRNELLGELKSADKEGLSFEDYHGNRINKLINSTGLTPEERAETEILLTDAFIEFGEDLFYGKLDPKELYAIWGIERKEIDPVKILREALENENLSAALDELRPQNDIYQGLVKSLAEYEQLKEEQMETIKIPEGDAIEPGKEDERIAKVAGRLKQLGLLDKDYQPTKNIYDDELQKAVMEFQTSRGLATDKILGNSTIEELNMDYQQRYNQILANLERWRWYPRDLGEHYILINIPDYKLAVVKDGDTIRQHNVIAGSKFNQTPVFSDSIRYIVINPVWNIPTSIRNNEIIPLASQNPNYLQSRNIYITGPEGNRIDPSSVDWSSDEARNYRFTQGSGPSNSLGRMKIIYPNKYAIYLHDTPAKAIFSQNARAESHGCVRVQDAIALAAYLVSEQEQWDLERINEVIATGKTKQVEVMRPVKVHHFYWTAWRNNGETIFTNDVYDLDDELIAALRE